MSRGVKKICFWVVVALIFAIQIYPIVWLIIASFRTNSELATNPFGSLEHLTIENYIDVIQNSNVFIYLKNSAFVTCVALVFVVMFSSMQPLQSVGSGLKQRICYFHILLWDSPFHRLLL